MADVIEISSSPEPAIKASHRITRSQSRDREAVTQKHARRKGKLPRIMPDVVIEFTDSEDDEPHSLNGVRILMRRNATADVDHFYAGPSGSAHSSKQTPVVEQDEVDWPRNSPHRVDVVSVPGASAEGSSGAGSKQLTSNPMDSYVAQILEIIQDVQPDHVLALVQQHITTYQEKVVEAVLHVLFEDPSYPKVEKRNGLGKRKRSEDPDDGRGKAKLKIDYGSKDRKYVGGADYTELAMERLMTDFPLIPKPHVRSTLFAHNGLYAPTHLRLLHEQSLDVLPYKPKSIPTRISGKGKGKAKHDAEFTLEREWLLLKLQENSVRQDTKLAEGLNEEEYEDCGEGIDCGCCFSSYPFDMMIQCPEAHLFCKNCMSTYAEGLLGSHDPNIKCMDQSGCKALFPTSELERFLSSKLLELYHRVTQTKAIEAAGLEGLEECPFCDYKVVIENDQEKLFRCENADCSAVTCRGCKKLDHLPKSCKEMEDDKVLDARHAIEEAMTQALMRNCPKCKKAFVKELGCNKMTCPNCRTVSCYICRKTISGYEHFVDKDPRTGVAMSSKKCPLWDVVEQRHNDEVKAARNKAMEEYKRLHPEVDDKVLGVDLPPPPPQPPAVHAGVIPGGVPLPAHHNAVQAVPQAVYNIYLDQRMLAHALPAAAPPALAFNFNVAPQPRRRRR